MGAYKLRKDVVDLKGRRFGRYVVLRLEGRRPNGLWWVCRCDCGTERAVRGSILKSGQAQSCGCLHRETVGQKGRERIKHGHARGKNQSKEYRAWCAMKDRCTNPSYIEWQHYGGRGIRVCDRWLHSFETFLADVGPAPSPAHSLNRLCNDGHYEPGNIAWATRGEQLRNKSTNRRISFGGETLSLVEWAERTGLNQTTIRRRLDQYGYTVEEALTLPKGARPAR